MSSINSRGKGAGYRYSACEESYDSTGSESENDSGCSHFYRQTAKVRFTRTTSKIQHHLQTKAASDEGKQELFGCLRRSSSTSQMSQYLESSHAVKGERGALGNRRSPESEKRYQELEKTRREIQRMDHFQQLEQQKREERSKTNSTLSSSAPLPSPPLCQPCLLPDSWITQLPSLAESSLDERVLPSSPSSSNSFCCWDWCVSDQSSWPPHVDLEPFTGNPMDWPFFIQRFKTWIHDAMPNDTLRMIYLEELLSPELRQKCVSHFIHPGRYRKLLAHLRNHYGHPLLVVRSCFEGLRQLAPMDSANLKSSLSDLSERVQHILAILKVVGCEEEVRSFAALELSGLVNKLSEDLREVWALHIKEKSSVVPLPHLGEFATWLERYAESTRRR